MAGQSTSISNVKEDIMPDTPMISSNGYAAEAAITKGQRRINLIWEATQSAISVLVTLAIIYTSVKGLGSETLTNAFFLIIGFYFSRTNHAAIGGVGLKPTQQPYEGR